MPSTATVNPKKLFLGVFLVLFAFCPGGPLAFDATSRLALARQLWTAGTVFLPTKGEGAWLQTPFGWTTYFAIGQSLIFVPFDVLGALLQKLTGSDVSRDLIVLYLYNPLAGTAWFIAVYLSLREFGLSFREAALGALLFFSTTIAFPYSNRFFQEETLAGAGVALALAASLRWRRTQSTRAALALGAACGLTLLFRVNAVFALMPVVVLFLSEAVRRFGLSSRLRIPLGLVALGAVPLLLVHLGFAYWRFGSPLSNGYDHLSIWRPFSLAICLGLLIGPGKGLAVLSPTLWLVPSGMRRSWREYSVLWVFSLAALVSSAVFCAHLEHPDGAWSWGTRYQVHLLSLFAYPIWLAAKELSQGKAGRWVVRALVFFGLVIQLAANVIPDTLEYYQLARVDDEGVKSLITDTGGGQLARRMQNLARVGRELASSGPTSGPNQVRPLFPNIWAVEHARFASSSLARALLLCLAPLLLAAGVFLIRMGLGQAV